MNLLDYVKVYKILTEKECNQIISDSFNYKFCRALTSKFGDDDANPKVDKFRTNKQAVIPYNSETDNFVYNKVSLAYSKWISDLTEFEQNIWQNTYTNVRDTGYEINKYDEKEYYNWHIDVIPTKDNERILSFVLYLNDDYEGGELEFPFFKYKPQKGHAILFPSNWMFPHTSLAIKSGTKYSLVTWIVNN